MTTPVPLLRPQLPSSGGLGNYTLIIVGLYVCGGVSLRAQWAPLAVVIDRGEKVTHSLVSDQRRYSRPACLLGVVVMLHSLTGPPRTFDHQKPNIHTLQSLCFKVFCHILIDILD